MDKDGKTCGTADGKSCCCPCHKLPGILIGLIGLVMLLGNTGVLPTSLTGVIWPILLILLGFMKACKGKCNCCTKG